MTSVAVKISAISNRPAAHRDASSQATGRNDGGFEALIGRDEKPAEPRAAATERSQPRRPAERNAAAERPGPADRPTETEAAAKPETSAADGRTELSDTPATETTTPTTVANTSDEEEARVADTTIAVVVTPAPPVITPVPAVPVSLDAPAASPDDATAAQTLTPADALPAQRADGDAAADPATAQPQQMAAAQASADDAAPADEQLATPATKAKAGKQNAEKASAQPAIAAASTLDDEQTAEAEALAADRQPAAPAPAQTPAARAPHSDPVASDPSGKIDDLLAAPKVATDPAAHAMPLMPQANAHPTAVAHGTQAAPVGAHQTAPVDAIAVDIAAQFKAGNSRFEIRLDPPELGRIDVRLDVDKEGHVTSRLIVERPETFDLLRRDQSSLERALQQAGLKTSDNALEFSLRDQGLAQQQQREDTPRVIRTLIAETDALPSEAVSGYARLLAGRSGVDIRV